MGRPREQTLAVTAHAPGVPPPPTQIVAVRQKALLPLWPPPLVLLGPPRSPPRSSSPGRRRRRCRTDRRALNAAQLATAVPASRRPPSSRPPGPPPGRDRDGDRAGAGRRRRRAARREARARGRREPRASQRAGPEGHGPRPGPDRAAQGEVQLDRRTGTASRASSPARPRSRASEARVGTGVTVWLATPDKKPAPLRPRTPPSPRRRSRWPICARSRSPTRRASGSTPRVQRQLPPQRRARGLRSDLARRPRRVPARRQLFIVSADEQPEPEPLTDAEGWTAHRGGGDACRRPDEQTLRVDELEVPCARRRRACRVGIRGRLADRTRRRQGARASPPTATTRRRGPHPRRSGPSRMRSTWPSRPRARPWSPRPPGLERVGDGSILPDIDAPCGIDFLDATRLAVACGRADPARRRRVGRHPRARR